ncbi:hypothetical protein ACFL0L_02355 [Patescibacteria group bacterium]
MNEDRWKQIVERVKDSLDVLEHETEDLDPGPGRVEFISFIGPQGKMKLERTSHPRVLDKKVIGSNRIGSSTSVENIYSDTEEVDEVQAYKWDDIKEEWEAISIEKTLS